MTRNEKKEERRKQILFKALELFVTKGFSETKIADIAQALDISTGLLFHYYDSKEELYLTLVQMGINGGLVPRRKHDEEPLEYFEAFLKELFTMTVTCPWIYQIFVLMNQARRPGIPEPIRKLALSAKQVELSAAIIEAGQKYGTIRQGDPKALSATFWSSIQGIMEQHAADPKLPLPQIDWVLDIIRAP